MERRRGSLAAVANDGHRATVLLWRRGARRPVRLPGGSIPTCETFGSGCPRSSISTSVDALDLGPRSVALVWQARGGTTTGVGPGWELRSVALATRRSTIVQSGYISGACGFHQPAPPSATAAGDVTYLDAGSPCDRLQTALARFDARARTRGEARPDQGYVFGTASDGATTYWLRGEIDPNSPGPYACSGCQLVASTDLPYQAGRRGAGHRAA